MWDHSISGKKISSQYVISWTVRAKSTELIAEESKQPVRINVSLTLESLIFQDHTLLLPGTKMSRPLEPLYFFYCHLLCFGKAACMMVPSLPTMHETAVLAALLTHQQFSSDGDS